WLRGQPREYRQPRDPAIAEWLGYRAGERGDISLGPSLGGVARAESSPARGRGWAWVGPGTAWGQALLIWDLLSMDLWYWDHQSIRPELRRILATGGAKGFKATSKLLLDMHVDFASAAAGKPGRFSEEADDLQAYFSAEYRHDVFPLI